MQRSGRRLLALGGAYVLLGFGTLVAFGGSSVLGVGFVAAGALFAAAGMATRNLGPAVMLNNAAHDLLTQGRYDEALALLDTIPPARRKGLVGMAVLSQRAYVRFAQGDTTEALALSDAALALSPPWIARSQGRQYRLALRANRALMLAAAGEATRARAEADDIDASPEALPLLRGTAALARAVTYARADDREALVRELSRSRALLDQLAGREAMLARALGRLVAVPAGGAYRAPAASQGSLSAAGQWVLRVVPQAAGFAPRAAEVAEAVDPARLPTATSEAQAKIVASREAAKRRAPSGRRWLVLAWLVLVGVFVGALPYLSALLGRRLNLSLLVVPVVGLAVWAVRRNRRVDRTIRKARALYADGQAEAADALLQRVSRDTTHTYAAIALHDLAEHAERRNDLTAALAHCDAALGRLFKNANVKANLSDILLPSIIALRARVLAATGAVDEALAELDVIAREHPAYPFAAGSTLAVRVLVALRLGDRALASALARTRTPDLRLPTHVAMLLDLLVGQDGWYEAEGEQARIEGELSAHPGLGAWIEHVAPGLVAGLPSGTSPTAVRIAPTDAATEPGEADTADAAMSVDAARAARSHGGA